jgi:hypothetical protein
MFAFEAFAVVGMTGLMDEIFKDRDCKPIVQISEMIL